MVESRRVAGPVLSLGCSCRINGDRARVLFSLSEQLLRSCVLAFALAGSAAAQTLGTTAHAGWGHDPYGSLLVHCSNAGQAHTSTTCQSAGNSGHVAAVATADASYGRLIVDAGNNAHMFLSQWGNGIPGHARALASYSDTVTVIGGQGGGTAYFHYALTAGSSGTYGSWPVATYFNAWIDGVQYANAVSANQAYVVPRSFDYGQPFFISASVQGNVNIAGPQFGVWDAGGTAVGSLTLTHITVIDGAGAATGFHAMGASGLDYSGSPGVSYCTSLPNSSGSAASIGTVGSNSIVRNDLRLTVDGVIPNGPGIFIRSPDRALVPFGNGYLCIGTATLGGRVRMGVGFADATGHVDRALDVTSSPQASAQIIAGSTWCFQYWFRDSGGATQPFGLSDAVEVVFCP